MIFSADTLHKVSEVQTVFHWDIEFTGNTIITDTDALKKRVTTAGLPRSTHSKIDLNTKGYTFPIPGRVNKNGDITITFFESVTADVIKMLQNWHNQIWSANDSDVLGKQQTDHQNLFVDITLHLQNKKDEDKQIYTLHRCIITDIDPGASELTDGSSPDYFKPVLNISYAWHNWKTA